jgi:hypothetical protein
MGLIGFSVFREKIESGDKAHTIRFRKVPPIVGEELFLWWKGRTKERELIGVTVCTKVERINIDPARKMVLIDDRVALKIELIRDDGFECAADFWEFFKDRKPSETGHLIHWEPAYITQQRIRPIVVEHGGFEQDKVGKLVPYKPSNGTCGVAFTEHWCGNCSRDKFNPETNKGDSCPIMMVALLGEQPKQWIEHEDDVCCTAFCKTKPPTPAEKYAALERKGQLNLLDIQV